MRTTRPSDREIKQRLTPLQYRVTQEDGTEMPFDNRYWDEKRPDIYVHIVSGEPPFASADKYESGTGWPSFTRPIGPDALIEKADRSWFGERTEVRSRSADSHLGHVFADRPAPMGLRFHPRRCASCRSRRGWPRATARMSSGWPRPPGTRTRSVR